MLLPLLLAKVYTCMVETTPKVSPLSKFNEYRFQWLGFG